jgi:hypothetical protein
MQDVREGRYPTDMYGFLYVLNDARSALQRVIEDRSERELTELRDAAGWAVKDHLYHLAAWERGIVYLLRKRPRHEGMGISERAYTELDVDAMNAVIFEQSRDLPLSETLQAFRSSHQEMLDLLATLSWDDLQLPYSHYAPGDTVEQGDQPVLYRVFGNTARHFDEHQLWIEAILAQGDDASD